MTLLEIVVATAIAGLALVGLFQAGSGGLFAADRAARIEDAVERAQSHLAAFGHAGSVQEGDTEGDAGGGYHWRLSVRPIATQQGGPYSRAGTITTLYTVAVTISWRERGRPRSIALETRSLGIATPR